MVRAPYQKNNNGRQIVNWDFRLFGFKWLKAKSASFTLFTAMVKGKWPFILVLTPLVVFEVLFPMRGWAQSFADTGAFYFTGQHNPRRAPIFREFMTGYGVTKEGLTGEGLKVGPVQLHPFLGVAEVYTDNVFRRDTNRRSDFLTTIAPGLQALLPFGGGRHSFLLDYRAGQFLYKKFSENNALAQDAQGHVSLNFPGGLKMDFQGGHTEGFDPRGSEVDTQQQDITKWNINSFLSQISYSGPGAGVRLRASYIDLHYKNNGQAPRRDRTRLRTDVQFLANLTPSTSALIGALITDYQYDKNKQLDGFAYGVFTGFEIAPSRLLSGNFNIGYTVLNNDRAPLPQPPSSGLSAGGKQQKALYMDGNLFWNPTSRSSVSAYPFRYITQSAVFNTATFIQTGVSISARHVLTERLAMRGNFYFANFDFDDGRNDNLFRWRIGPEYRAIKWLGFKLDYIFDKRYSNQSNFNFYGNTIMLSIQGFL